MNLDIYLYCLANNYEQHKVLKIMNFKICLSNQTMV